MSGSVVDEIEESHDVEAYIATKTKKRNETVEYPENYKTCVNLFWLLSVVFKVICESIRIEIKIKITYIYIYI